MAWKTTIAATCFASLAWACTDVTVEQPAPLGAPGYPECANGGCDPTGQPPDWDGGFPTFDATAPDASVTLHPDFGPTVTQATPPPPLSGGTLAVSRDGKMAVAADPDRDQVHVVDLTLAVSHDVALQAGDEPGRVALDGSARAFVALRRGGAIATIDLATHALTSRRAVCAAPRGVAYDATSASVHVACASGELVTLPAAGGAPTRTVTVAPDLRDVILVGGTLFVSTFRTADVLQLASDGSIARHLVRPPLNGTPTVAWRLATNPAVGFGAVVQSANESSIPPGPGGYGGVGCGGAVTNPGFAAWGNAGEVIGGFELPAAAMPIDLAFGPNGEAVVVFAGEWKMPGSMQVGLLGAGGPGIPLGKHARHAIPPPPNDGDAGFDDGGQTFDPDAGAPCGSASLLPVNGQAVALAYDDADRLYVQTREPTSLVIDFLGAPRTIVLATSAREDTGHDVFHSDQGGGIACASCHVEGGDDGRAWSFSDVGPRRTPSMLGTLDGTAPYHWKGEETDLPMLYAGALARMDGIAIAPDQVDATSHWLTSLTGPPSLAKDAAAVARGAALFTSAKCDSCHAGAKGTNNENMNVATGLAGESFQVPPLVGVAWKPPYLHGGCAASLADALGSVCTSGPAHGNAGTLSSAQIADLVEYLKSL